MDYSIAPGWKWVSDKEAVGLCERLNMLPQHRLLLLSDGSLTNFLEALSGSPVDVEIKNHETRRLNKEEAAYLEVIASQDAIVRDVWLIQNRKKLVYARSVFPLAGLAPDRFNRGLDKDFLNKIATSIEPLGRSLTEQGLLTFKDKLAICAVHCSDINNLLNLASRAILWAKRYRLTAEAASGGKCITASVTEIFSPELVGKPSLNAEK